MSTPVSGTLAEINYPQWAEEEHLARTGNDLLSAVFHLLSLLSKLLNDINSQLIQKAFPLAL